MEKTTIIETWGPYIILGSYFLFIIALLIIIYHEIKIIMTKDYEQRYNYVNQHEIQYFWYSIIAVIAGLSLYLTVKVTPMVAVDGMMRIFVGVFFLAAFVVISYMFLASQVKVLYPKFLERRLMRIRNKPRFSSAGNIMKKLSSEEGAVHLEADQIAAHQSKLQPIQYDVWVDEKTGERKVEKYSVNEHVEKCNECGFYTLRIKSEEVTKQPSEQEAGILVEHYVCDNCNHREAREATIASLASNLKSVG